MSTFVYHVIYLNVVLNLYRKIGMDIRFAKDLFSLIKEYGNRIDFSGVIDNVIEPAPTIKFHHWADGKNFEGGFLFKNSCGDKIWLLLLEWNVKNGYYAVIFPEDKSGPLAEIHQQFSDTDGEYLRWKYSPSKKDGRNKERKQYFEKYFQSCEVVLSLPSSTEDVVGFIDELFSLAENRIAADKLSLDTPTWRESFPEGKIKEELHKSRERNTKLVKQVKAEAIAKYGKLECQCCGFDFERTYGKLGSGFIEAHHTLPISELHSDGGSTRKEDIALVCSNCHRMLHRRRPWLTMNEIKKLTENKETASDY